MNYSQMVSALQRRVSLRSAAIGHLEQWKKVHRAQEQMSSWRETKGAIAELAASQMLDRKLLRITQEIAYMDALMAAGVWEGL